MCFDFCPLSNHGTYINSKTHTMTIIVKATFSLSVWEFLLPKRHILSFTLLHDELRVPKVLFKIYVSEIYKDSDTEVSDVSELTKFLSIFTLRTRTKPSKTIFNILW